jgi:hypothetical protein
MLFSIDANVPISFNESKHFDFLEKFKHNFTIDEENLKECSKDGLYRKVSNIQDIDINFTLPEELVLYVEWLYKEKLKKPIHQKNKNDYRVIANAIDKEADYILTNDRILFHTFNKIRNIDKQEKKLIPDNLKIIHIAAFLRLLPDMGYDTKLVARLNKSIYCKTEIPNNTINIQKMGWKIIHVQEIFNPYGDNLINLAKG